MTATDYLLLVVAGYFAGLIGFTTGLASLVSYPALLAVGLPPVAANVTNTVALVAVGVGSTANSARALAELGRDLLRWIALAAAGGVVGAVVLLITPKGSFEVVVPALILLASAALVAQPRIRKLAERADLPWLFPVGVFVVTVYGGYFGAGAGVVFLALTLVGTSLSLFKATALKSLLLGVANLVAAIGFGIFGPVHWLAALAMGVGCLAGGWSGPPVVRVIPPKLLRIVVAIGGVGLAIWLWVQ